MAEINLYTVTISTPEGVRSCEIVAREESLKTLNDTCDPIVFGRIFRGLRVDKNLKKFSYSKYRLLNFSLKVEM